MKRMIRLLMFLKPFWNWVLLSIILGIAAIASGMGLLGVSADIIARAALHPSIAELQVGIVAVRFLGLSRAIYRYLERLVSHSVNFRLLADIRIWFYERLVPLIPAKTSKYHSADIMGRSLDDLQTLENFYVRVVSPVIIASVIVTFTGVFFLQFHYLLSLIVFIGLIISGGMIPLSVYFGTKKFSKQYIEKRGELTAYIFDNLQGSDDIAVFNNTEQRINELKILSADFGKAQNRLVRIGALQNSLNLIVTNLTLWIFLLVAIPQVVHGNIDGYLLASLSVVVIASFESIQPLSLVSQNLESCFLAAKRLFQIVDEIPEVNWTGDDIRTNDMDINIQHLSFRYPDSVTIPILEDINLSIPFGIHLGIIGKSGVGKTTLINVLLRFWNVESGTILVNGIDIRNYHPQQIRAKIGVISQSTYIFSDTLRSNMLLANPDATDDMILDALFQVGLGNWVDTLPGKLDSWMGEHGRFLSGGERQRLGIARLILKDSPVWLLDEPTSYLDPVNQDLVFKIIMECSQDRTLCYFTHQPYGLELMDELVVFEHANIVARGTHQELLATNDYYRRMRQLQEQVFSSPILDN